MILFVSQYHCVTLAASSFAEHSHYQDCSGGVSKAVSTSRPEKRGISIKDMLSRMPAKKKPATVTASTAGPSDSERSVIQTTPIVVIEDSE